MYNTEYERPGYLEIGYNKLIDLWNSGMDQLSLFNWEIYNTHGYVMYYMFPSRTLGY